MADEGEAGEDGGTPPAWRSEWMERGINKEWTEEKSTLPDKYLGWWEEMWGMEERTDKREIKFMYDGQKDVKGNKKLRGKRCSQNGMDEE